MQENLKYKSTVSDAVTYSTNATAKMVELDNKLNELTTSLTNGTWQGDSYTKCVNVHTLIMQYFTQLQQCGGDIQLNCISLRDTVDTFYANSTNVVDVGNW